MQHCDQVTPWGKPKWNLNSGPSSLASNGRGIWERERERPWGLLCIFPERLIWERERERDLLSNNGILRVVRCRGWQKGLQRKKCCLKSQSRAPLILQDIQAYCAVLTANVGVPFTKQTENTSSKVQEMYLTYAPTLINSYSNPCNNINRSSTWSKKIGMNTGTLQNTPP